MAEDKIIFDVEVKAGAALSDLARLSARMDELRAQRAAMAKQAKEEGGWTEENRKRYEAIGQELKAVGKEYAAAGRVAQGQLASMEQRQKSYGDSIIELRNQLSNLQQQYFSLSKAEREGAAGTALRDQINEVTDTIKGAEEGIQVYTRNVGNYRSALDGFFSNNTPVGFLKQIGSLVPTTAEGFKAAGQAVMGFGKQLLALLANPIVAIIAAIAVVIKGVTDAIKGSETQSDRMAVVMARLEPIVNAVKNAFSALAAVVVTIIDVWSKGVSALLGFYAAAADAVAGLFGLNSGLEESLKASQEATVRIAEETDAIEEANRSLVKSEAETQRDVAILRDKSIQKDKYTLAERLAFLDEAIEKEQAVANEREEIARRELELLQLKAAQTENDAEMNDALAQAEAKVAQAEAARYETTKRLQSQRQTLIEQEQKEREEAAKAAAAKAKEIRDAAYASEEAAMKYADTLAKMRAAREQAAAATYEDGARLRAEEYARAEASEIALLELRRKYGKVTRTEYERELTLIAERRKDFEQEELTARKEHLEELMKSVKGVLTEGIEEEIKAAQDKYAEAVKALREMQAPTDADSAEYEEFYLRRAELEKEIEEAKEKEIAAIREKYRNEEYAKDIEEIEKKYAASLAAAEGNARATAEVNTARLSEEYTAAVETYGAESVEAIRIRKEQSKIEEEIAKLDDAAALLRAKGNASEVYEIKKAALERQKEAAQGNADELARIENEIAELSKSRAEQVAQNVTEMLSAANDIATSLGDLAQARSDAEQERDEKRNEEQKAALKERLDSGKISQEEYDKEVAKLDEELDKKTKKRQLEDAKRQKAISLLTAVTETAAAIMKSISASPLTFGLPFSAVAAAQGAIQIATIMAQPLPQAKRGILVGEAAQGGWLSGARHSEGGIPIEAEDGEVIINRRSSARFRSLLSEINAAGGGRRFASGGMVGDGGYILRESERASAMTSESIAAAMSAVRIYTAVEDINRGQGNYAIINDNKY